MKIINEKGKLFGLINVVDLVVLVAVIAVVGAIAYQLLGDDVADAVNPQVELTARVAIAGSNPSLVEEVKRQDLVGEYLVANGDNTSAYISDVWFEDYVMSVESADGQLVRATDPEEQTIWFEIKTTVARGTLTPTIGSQEIRVGRAYNVKTRTFECDGIIYYVEIDD